MAGGEFDQYARGEQILVNRREPGFTVPIAIIARRWAAGVIDENIDLARSGDQRAAYRRFGDTANDRRHRNIGGACPNLCRRVLRSEEHTSELQSLMRISYAVFCLKKKNQQQNQLTQTIQSN